MLIQCKDFNIKKMIEIYKSQKIFFLDLIALNFIINQFLYFNSKIYLSIILLVSFNVITSFYMLFVSAF